MEETAYFRSVLTAMHEREPTTKFVLVGHSIGGYMCTEALKHAPELPILASALVFPFLSLGTDKRRLQNWLDKRTWPAYMRPLLNVAFGTIGRAGYVWSALGDVQRRFLVKTFGGGAGEDDLCREVCMYVCICMCICSDIHKFRLR